MMLFAIKNFSKEKIHTDTKKKTNCRTSERRKNYKINKSPQREISWGIRDFYQSSVPDNTGMERSDVTLHFETPLGVLKHRKEGEVVPLERPVGRNNGHKHVFLLQGNERLLCCVQTIFLYFFFWSQFNYWWLSPEVLFFPSPVEI